jgi:hypothetical protein
MGFLRKITGAQGQIDAAKKNAAAQEDATKQSAAAAERASMQSAKAAADQQAQLAARSAAEQKANDAVSKPLGQVDVSVDTDATSTADVRKRRARFGKDYTSGVKI